MVTSNLPVTEFKTLVIKMLNELRGRIDNLSENFNKEVRNIKMEIALKKSENEGYNK